MSVKVHRLNTGEEIIGEVTSENDCHIELKNPANIVMQKTEQGVGVGLVPWMAYAQSNKVTIFQSHVQATCEIDDQLRNEYSRIFGTGIQIASADQIPKG